MWGNATHIKKQKQQQQQHKKDYEINVMLVFMLSETVHRPLFN